MKKAKTVRQDYRISFEPKVTRQPEKVLTKVYFALSAIVVAAMLWFGA